MESSGGLYVLPWEVQLQGTLGWKDSCYLNKWEFNGAGFFREKLWEVWKAQDRQEDQVWGRTKQDSERLGSRNHSKGFMATGAWLVYWLVYHQLSLLPLQHYFIQIQSPRGKSTGWALSIGICTMLSFTKAFFMQVISLPYLVVIKYFLFNLETHYPAPQATAYVCKTCGLCRGPAPCC